jgi:hypothetical protein
MIDAVICIVHPRLPIQTPIENPVSKASGFGRSAAGASQENDQGPPEALDPTCSSRINAWGLTAEFPAVGKRQRLMPIGLDPNVGQANQSLVPLPSKAVARNG